MKFSTTLLLFYHDSFCLGSSYVATSCYVAALLPFCLATRICIFPNRILAEFCVIFPRANRTPTLTCDSSQATLIQSSSHDEFTLKSRNIFTIYYVSYQTYSYAFYKFSTRSKLMCSNVVSPTDSVSCCAFWCTR